MPKSTGKEKILIFGYGQIGNFYRDYFFNKTDHKVILSSVNVTKIEELEEEFKRLEPTVVINTAGKTNLEWIDKNPLEAFHVNVLGADNIAKLCDKFNAYYVFLSSGCIFESKDEKDAKKETDAPSPQAYYSWTKVWAEQLIVYKKSENFKCLILRPRQPISSEVNHKNMLVKLLTFTRFIDTPNTGTVIEDLMDWTKELMEKRVTGTIHAANEGYSTPYQIAHMLKEHVLPELEVNYMSKEELDAITPVKRVDTILNVDQLKKHVKVESYDKRLEDVIRKLGENFREESKEKVEEHMKKTYEATKQRAVPNSVWQKLFEPNK